MSNEIALMKEIAKLQLQIDALRTVEIGKPFYDDLRFPATPGQRNPATTAPDFDFTNIGFLFDPGTNEYIYIVAQMPHDWVAGSTIYPHVHWMPTTTDTGVVRWAMTYKWTNIGAADAGSATSISGGDAAVGTAYTHQTTEIPDTPGIAGTGMTSSSILSIIFWRNAVIGSDTYTGDALLKEFDIHYLKDPSKSYWSGSY